MRPTTGVEKETVYDRSVLESGVRIVSEHMPHVRSVSIGVWIQAGSRDEAREESGISHFLEHMVFKGTTNRTAEEIAQSLESVGGQLNASTSKELTCFYARVLDEHVPMAIDVLADILTNPLFGEEDIEKEKQVVCEEIKSLNDTPDELIHDLFCQSLFEPHPLAWPILGREETVRCFSEADLRQYLSRYGADRVVVAAAGNIEHADLVDLVRAHFHFPTTGKEGTFVGFPRGARHIDVHSRDISQTHLCLGMRGYPFAHPQRYSLLVLSTLLGGGMSSRLFQKVREREGLAYSIFTFLDFFADTGILGAYVGTDSSQMKRALAMIVNEFQSCATDRVPDDELARIKSQLKGNLMLGLESTNTRMVRVAKLEIYLNAYASLDETLADIDGVTAEQVWALANDLFDPQTLTLTVLGPVSEDAVTEEDLFVPGSSQGKDGS